MLFLHRSADVCELYEGEVGGYCAGRLHCGQSSRSNCHHHHWPGEVGARWDHFSVTFIMYLSSLSDKCKLNSLLKIKKLME